MIETDRAEVFDALAQLARRYPHWRVGQLIANVAGWADAEVWDAEDEQLLAAAREHLNILTQRNGDTDPPNAAPYSPLLEQHIPPAEN